LTRSAPGNSECPRFFPPPRFFPAKRYLSLKLFSRDALVLTIYPYDGTPALKITLAVIRWAKRKWAGVEFVKLSQEAREKLQQLCQQQVVLTVAG